MLLLLAVAPLSRSGASVYPDFAGEWSGTVTITKLTGLDVEPSQQQVHECPLRLWVHADGTATAELDLSEAASGLASGTVVLAEDALSNSVASLSLSGDSTLAAAMSGFPADKTVAHTLTLELDTADPDRMTGTYDQLCTECPGSLGTTGNADLRRLTSWTDSAVPTAGSRTHTPGHGYTTETLHKSSDFNSSIIQGLIADTDAWEPNANGQVFAVACGANTVYLGGFFSYIGPRTGAGVPLDINTGLPESPYPMVERAEGEIEEVIIWTCVSDGNGGWFIGGRFKSVGGALRDNLAHILPNGTVDPDWNPGVSGVMGGGVNALFLCGNILYVGGAFNVVDGRWRENIAALDAYTGSVTDWDPVANGMIDNLVASATRVYVTGGFSSIGGQDRNYLAALDATTGAAVTDWNPNPNNYVFALALDGDRLYVGGTFNMIGGQTQSGIAALDAATGSVIADWNPNLSNTVYALAVDGSVVYAGGRFLGIGGQPHNIAALDTATGAVITTWAPNPNGHVYVLAASNTMVYAGGSFISVDGQGRYYIAALDKSSGAVTAWNIMAGNAVETLAIHGETIYAGGRFTSVGGEERNNVAALDTSTGALTTWNPDANDIVETLLLTDTAVYAGGGFTEIGGETRHYLAKLDTTVGSAVPEWAPEADDCVLALDVSSTSVYAGGCFTNINGQPRNYLAALDKSTGSLSSWNPDVNNYVRSLDVTADTVYFGGDFTTVGGQTRLRIAAVGAVGTASDDPTAWNPNAGTDSAVWAIVVSDDTVYAGGEFPTIGGQPRNCIAALNVSDGSATSWNPGANGLTETLAVSGDTVYAGGYFTNLGGLTRRYIGAVSTTNGLATSWNPIADGEIRALAVSGVRIYVGGRFSSIGGNPRNGFAVLMDCGPEALRLLERSRDYATDDLNAAGYDYSEAASSFTEPIPSPPAEPADRDTPEEALLVATELFLQALAAYPGDSEFEEGLLESLELYADGCALVGNEALQAGLRIKNRETGDRTLTYEINQAEAASDSFLEGLHAFHRVLGTPGGLAAVLSADAEVKEGLRDRYAILTGRWIRASYEQYLREFERDYRSTPDTLASWDNPSDPVNPGNKARILAALQDVLVQSQLCSEVLGVLCADKVALKEELAQVDAELEETLGLMSQISSGLNPLGFSEDKVPWAYRTDGDGDNNYEQVLANLIGNSEQPGSFEWAEQAETGAETNATLLEDSRQHLLEMLYNQWQSSQFLVGEALQICGADPSDDWGVDWDGPWNEASVCKVGTLLQSLKTQRDKLALVNTRMENHFQRLADLEELARIEADAAEAQIVLILEGGEAVAASSMGFKADRALSWTEYELVRVPRDNQGEASGGASRDYDVRRVPIAHHCLEPVLDSFVQDLNDSSKNPNEMVGVFKNYLDDIARFFGSKRKRQQGQTALIQALQNVTSMWIEAFKLSAQRQQQINDEYLRMAETAAEYTVELDVLQNIATELNILLERKEFLRSQLIEAQRRHAQISEGSGQDVTYYRMMRNTAEQEARLWFQETQMLTWMLIRAVEQDLCLERWESRDTLYQQRNIDDLRYFATVNLANAYTGYQEPQPEPIVLRYSLQEDLLHYKAGYPDPRSGHEGEVLTEDSAEDAFLEFVQANVAASGGSEFRVVFPLSLRTNANGLPGSSWDVQVESIMLQALENPNYGSLGNTGEPLLMLLSPSGPSMTRGYTSNPETIPAPVISYILDDFRYPEMWLNPPRIKWLTWPAHKTANVVLNFISSPDGHQWMSSENSWLKGYHLANPRWEFSIPLDDEWNSDITNELASLVDVDFTFTCSWRSLVGKQGSGQ
ncbi:MAG: hypothetical protein KBC05_04165 [Candidatus Hydrogenedentes bacterium]|nr:hypothetical protein [Candidatus Hydrogenedentota bacterium]